MELPGEIFEIHHQYDFVVNTANWFIKQGKLKPTDCPVVLGEDRKEGPTIINTEPKRIDGNKFKRPRELANGL